jgi:hypothetical protein
MSPTFPFTFVAFHEPIDESRKRAWQALHPVTYRL